MLPAARLVGRTHRKEATVCRTGGGLEGVGSAQQGRQYVPVLEIHHVHADEARPFRVRVLHGRWHAAVVVEQQLEACRDPMTLRRAERLGHPLRDAGGAEGIRCADAPGQHDRTQRAAGAGVQLGEPLRILRPVAPGRPPAYRPDQRIAAVADLVHQRLAYRRQRRDERPRIVVARRR